MKTTPELLNLIALAKVARHHVEKLAEIENIPGAASSLSGYCAIASKYLIHLANQNELKPIFVTGLFNKYNRIIDTYEFKSGHCWLEYAGYIVDITATQFAYTTSKTKKDFTKKVYVCKASNPHYSKKYINKFADAAIKTWHDETFTELISKIKQVSNAWSLNQK